MKPKYFPVFPHCFQENVIFCLAFLLFYWFFYINWPYKYDDQTYITGKVCLTLGGLVWSHVLWAIKQKRSRQHGGFNKPHIFPCVCDLRDELQFVSPITNNDSCFPRSLRWVFKSEIRYGSLLGTVQAAAQTINATKWVSVRTSEQRPQRLQAIVTNREHTDRRGKNEDLCCYKVYKDLTRSKSREKLDKTDLTCQQVILLYRVCRIHCPLSNLLLIHLGQKGENWILLCLK